MPFVDSAGARIYWNAEGQGAPVLLIMGHLYSSEMWYPLLPALTQSHRALWFDNRGVGQSATTADVTIGQLAKDALAVMEAAGVQKAHVYGVSMGGGIAAEFALRYPERTVSLVLGCTAMKTEKVAVPWVAQLLYSLPQPWFQRALLKRSNAASFGTAAPPEAVERAREVLAGLKFTMKGVREQLFAIANYATSRQAVAQLNMPVLVLHGDLDQAVPVAKGQELHAAIPGSRMQIFEGAGHNYLVACSVRSTAAVIEFFAETNRVD